MKKLFLLAHIFMPSILLAAMVDLNTYIIVPQIEGTSLNQAPSFAVVNLDADGEKTAAIFQYTSTKSIKKIQLNTQNITTGGVLDWRLETVDTIRGFPSGDLYCTNSSGTFTIGSANDNMFVSSDDMINTSCIPTYSTPVAIVLVRNDATFVGGLNVSISDYDLQDFPFRASSITAGGYSKVQGVSSLLMVHQDDTYLRNHFIVPYGVATSSSPTASMFYMGNKFTLPYKARVIGAYLWCNTNYPYKLSMWVGDSEVANVQLSSTTRNLNVSQKLVFTSTANTVVNAETPFYLTMSTTGAAATLPTFYIYEATSTAVYNAVFPMGSRVVGVRGGPTLSLESDWSVEDRKRFTIYAIIDQIDVTTGASGGSFPYLQ